MEKNAERDDNTLEAFPKVPPEIQLWNDEFESRAPNNIGKTECSRFIFGCRVTGD